MKKNIQYIIEKYLNKENNGFLSGEIKNLLDAGFIRFKKEYPALYQTSRMVFDDGKQKDMVLQIINNKMKTISAKNRKRLEELSEKQRKKEIIQTISVILALDVNREALKITNKSLEKRKLF